MRSASTLIDCIYAKIYQALAAGDPTKISSSAASPFVSFCYPAQAVEPEMLELRHIDSMERMEWAAWFADMANVIPPTDGFWRADGSKVWDVYGNVLAHAVLPESVLSPQETETLRKARELLWQTEVVPHGAAVSELRVETPIYREYNRLQEEYGQIALEYASRQHTVMSQPDDAMLQAQWKLDARHLQARMKKVSDRLTAAGRHEVERALAVIDVLSARDPYSTWREYRIQFEGARRQDFTGYEFLLTMLDDSVAELDAAKRWTRVAIYGSELDHIDLGTRSQWGGGVRPTDSLIRVQSTLNSPEPERTMTAPLAFTNFEVSFDLARVRIRRPWFSRSLLSSRAWRWSSHEFRDICDGRVPPAGDMAMFPTHVLLVRNVIIETNEGSVLELVDEGKLRDLIQASFGPFTLHGGSALEHFRARPRATQIPGPLGNPLNRPRLPSPVVLPSSLIARLPATGSWPGRTKGISFESLGIKLGSFATRSPGPAGASAVVKGWTPMGFAELSPNDMSPAAGPMTNSPGGSVDAKVEKERATIRAPGLQILGFLCERLPACPRPDPSYKWT